MMNIRKFCLFILPAMLTGCNSTDVNIIPTEEFTSTENDITTDNDNQIILIPVGSEVQSSEPADYDEPESESEATQEVTVPVVTEEPTLESAAENKHIILIDPGHGGREYGACYNGLSEKDLTIKVGLYLKDYLETNYSDIAIYMTRTEDVHLSSDSKQDLQQRCDMAAQVGAEYMISLHFNSDGLNHTASGALICATSQNGLKEQSEALGNLVLAHLQQLGIGSQGVFYRLSDTYFYDDGSPKDYYAINRHASEYGIPSIIIEHVFIDNPSEIGFVDSDDDLYRLAEADALAIAEYFSLNKR